MLTKIKRRRTHEIIRYQRSIIEWQNFKRQYFENFWQHLESRNIELNKIAIQELINEDFNLQIGTLKY